MCGAHGGSAHPVEATTAPLRVESEAEHIRFSARRVVHWAHVDLAAAVVHAATGDGAPLIEAHAH